MKALRILEAQTRVSLSGRNEEWHAGGDHFLSPDCGGAAQPMDFPHTQRPGTPEVALISQSCVKSEMSDEGKCPPTACW